MVLGDAVRYRFRAEARRRANAWLALGVVFGVGAGALVAAVAGAERTSSAYDRFVEAQQGIDAVVEPVDFCETCDVRLAAGLPMVRESVRILAASPAGGRVVGHPIDPGEGAFLFVGSEDGRFGREINRWHLLEGRLPDPSQANEVIVTKDFAERAPLYVGDHLLIDLFIGEEETTTVGLDVVGIEIAPNELEPRSGGALAAVYTGPAFVEAHPDVFQVEVLGVVLEGGVEARSELAEDLRQFDLQLFELVDSQRQTEAARARFETDATGLLVFAGLGAITVLVLFAQALHRQQVIDLGDQEQLQSIGCTRRDLRAIARLRAMVVALSATAVAIGVAMALSPLAPIGEARVVEPDPGVAMDGSTLGLGALVVLVVLAGVGSATAEGPLRRRDVSARRAPRAAARARHGLPGLRLRLGSGLAFERSGRQVPAASIITSLSVAVATVAGAATFAASLHRLQTTPALFGRPWDAVALVEDPMPYLETGAERDAIALAQAEQDSPLADELLSATLPERAARALAELPDVEAVSLGRTEDVLVDGRAEASSISLTPLTGDLRASLVRGRLPEASDEVAIGSRLLAELGLGIGDTVTIGPPAEDPAPTFAASERRIVGQSVTANLGLVDGLGGGVVQPGSGGGDLIFVTFSSDRAAEEIIGSFADRGLFDASSQLEGGGARLLDTDGMESTPRLIALLTAFLGVATLVHFGVVAARRHRRHLGVLRALGLRRRDCVIVLVWHGLLITAAAAAIGLPLGILAGRLAWRATARGLYVVSEIALPHPALLAGLVGLGIMVTVAMATPGWLTSRAHPSVALRAE